MIDEQRLAGAAHALGVLPLAVVELGVQQQAGQADDAVHRRADLVAHRGQERRLGPRALEGGVARLGELAPRLALRAQQAGGADEGQHQQDAHADRQLDRLHTEADPDVDQDQCGRHHQRQDRDAELGERGLGLVVGRPPGARSAWDRKPRAIRTAPTSQPAFSQLSLKSDSGSIRKPRSATSHRHHAERERSRTSRCAGAAVGQDPDDQGEQDRVGHRVDRPDELDHRLQRLVAGDRVDGEVPQHQHADRDDGQRVDHGVDVDPAVLLGPDQGDPQRRDHEDVGQQPADVGERRRR